MCFQFQVGIAKLPSSPGSAVWGTYVFSGLGVLLCKWDSTCATSKAVVGMHATMMNLKLPLASLVQLSPQETRGLELFLGLEPGASCMLGTLIKLVNFLFVRFRFLRHGFSM